MESVLLTTPLHFLRMKEEQGYKFAKIFTAFKQNIDKPLSAILSLNTISNTIGAAGVGAQVIKLFGDLYFGIAIASLTVLILIFSEIIPKTIGSIYWRQLSPLTAYLIRFTLFVMFPFVIVSALITRFISSSQKNQMASREEFSALSNLVTDEGIFAEKENLIIQNIIKLKNIKTSEIMTPRVVVAIANETMHLNEFLENKEFLQFSRIPVYHDDVENITGYILRQTVFEKLTENKENLKLADIKRNITIVPESATLLNLWEILLDNKEYIALVIDEYGGMAGIVTIEDLVESVLGFEIIDEKDTISDMQEYARQRWKLKQIKQNFLKNRK